MKLAVIRFFIRPFSHTTRLATCPSLYVRHIEALDAARSLLQPQHLLQCALYGCAAGFITRKRCSNRCFALVSASRQ